MGQQPDSSIPQQAGAWSATLGTYRFLNNERIEPQAISRPVIEQTRQACGAHPVVLCVHDLTELDPVYDISPTRLYQHTVLAVDGGEQGQVLGLLHQHWFDDPKAPAKEKRRQRRQRWTRSCSWPDAVAAVGEAQTGTRWIMVADREADDFQVFTACNKVGAGWLIRCQHDRYLHAPDGQASSAKLRSTLVALPAAGTMTVSVSRRPARKGAGTPPKRWRNSQGQREAKVQVRYQKVTLATPRNDNRYKQPQTMYAVSVTEVDAPEGVEPIDWVLLTSEAVTTWAEALKVIEWYCRRWLIEEFHKAQKTGCRLEKSQLQSNAAVCRLAAISAAVSVRLLQVRQAADDPRTADEPACEHVDKSCVAVVAYLIRHPTPESMTVRQFYHAVARHGGWLGRKGDGRPGWQSLHHGCRRIADYVAGIQMYQQMTSEDRNCV